MDGEGVMEAGVKYEGIAVFAEKLYWALVAVHKNRDKEAVATAARDKAWQEEMRRG
jgi:hypothetical protein